MYLCLNKLTSKYGKRIVQIFLYTLYEAWRISAIIFQFIFSCFSFFSNATNSFIHSLNSFILKKSWCWFPSSRCPFCFLYIQIYLLSACKVDWEENLFDFRIKILMNITSVSWPISERNRRIGCFVKSALLRKTIFC